MILVWFSACLLSQALCFLTGSAHTDETSKIVTRGKQATALVEVKSVGALGTAFCVSSAGFFITNEHVVRGSTQGEKVTLVLNPGERDQKIVQASMVRTDQEADLALLKVEGNVSLTVLPLGNSDNLVETTPVTAFGYPFGKDLATGKDDYPNISVSTGHITALRKNQGVLQSIQLDASLNPGNSGGPVLNEKGHVIGVVASGIAGAAINFAIPVSSLNRFLSKTEIVFIPPALTRANQSAKQKFTIRLVSFFPVEVPSEVELTLSSPGDETRHFIAKPAGENTYAVQTIPIPATVGIGTLRLTVVQEGQRLTFRAKDRILRVGKEEIRLSTIQQITPGERTSVLLTNGRQVVGALTGLNALEASLNGVPLALNLSKATQVRIESFDEPVDYLDYSVTAKKGNQVLAEIAGTLPIEGIVSPIPVNLHNLTQNSANRHWYGSVELIQGILWKEAREQAERMSYRGRKGHLVTLTSAEENAFVVRVFPHAVPGAYWIGAFKDLNDSNYKNPSAGWKWVTGEPWLYTNWCDGEPNGDYGGIHSDFAQFWGPGQWNDQFCPPIYPVKGYIVEFE